MLGTSPGSVSSVTAIGITGIDDPRLSVSGATNHDLFAAEWQQRLRDMIKRRAGGVSLLCAPQAPSTGKWRALVAHLL